MANKPQPTTKINAKTADAKRMDRIAAKLEAQRGGSWNRAQTLDWLLGLGEREFSQPTMQAA